MVKKRVRNICIFVFLILAVAFLGSCAVGIPAHLYFFYDVDKDTNPSNDPIDFRANQNFYHNYEGYYILDMSAPGAGLLGSAQGDEDQRAVPFCDLMYDQNNDIPVGDTNFKIDVDVGHDVVFNLEHTFEKSEGSDGTLIFDADSCNDNMGRITEKGTCKYGLVASARQNHKDKGDMTIGPFEFTDKCVGDTLLAECFMQGVEVQKNSTFTGKGDWESVSDQLFANPRYMIVRCPDDKPYCNDGACSDTPEGKFKPLDIHASATQVDNYLQEHKGIITQDFTNYDFPASPQPDLNQKIEDGETIYYGLISETDDTAFNFVLVNNMFRRSSPFEVGQCKGANGIRAMDTCTDDNTVSECYYDFIDEQIKFNDVACPSGYTCQLVGGGGKCVLDNDFDNDGYDSEESGGLDCDDNNPAVNPGMPEDCTDGIDNNCNGEVDEAADDDGDGYSTCGEYIDCDDNNSAINPGMEDACLDLGVDNNCDGLIDEACDGDDGIDQCTARGATWLGTPTNGACCGDDVKKWNLNLKQEDISVTDYFCREKSGLEKALLSFLCLAAAGDPQCMEQYEYDIEHCYNDLDCINNVNAHQFTDCPAIGQCIEDMELDEPSCINLPHKAESFSISDTASGDYEACFNGLGMKDTGSAGENIIEQLDSEDGWHPSNGDPIHSYSEGLDTPLEIEGATRYESGFIEIPRSMWGNLYYFAADVKVDNAQFLKAKVKIKETYLDNDGEMHNLVESPDYVFESDIGDTYGTYVTVKGYMSLPTKDNKALQKNKRKGIKIAFEKSGAMDLSIKNIVLYPVIAAQVLHNDGQFYTCGPLNKTIAFSPDGIRNDNWLRWEGYTQNKNKIRLTDKQGMPEAGTEDLVPAANEMNTCGLVGNYHCQSNSRWEVNEQDALGGDYTYEAKSLPPDIVSVVDTRDPDDGLIQTQQSPYGQGLVFQFGMEPVLQGMEWGGINLGNEEPPGIIDNSMVFNYIGPYFGNVFPEGLPLYDPNSWSISNPEASITPADSRYVPYTQGCCPSTWCWNGRKCIPGDQIRTGTEEPDFAMGEYAFICSEGQWDIMKEKDDQYYVDKGYCSATQCFYDPDISVVNDSICVADGFYDKDFYCSSGKWESRTALLAAHMLDITDRDFSLYCSDPWASTNEVDYISEVTGIDIEPLIQPLASDCLSGDECPVNSICALRYCVDAVNCDEENVVLGFTLNLQPNTTSSKSKSILRMFNMDTFNSIASDHHDYCDGAIAQSSVRYLGCDGPTDYIDAGNPHDLWYNSKFNTMIFAKDDVTIGAATTGNKIVDAITNPFTTIFDTAVQLFGLTIDSNAANLGMLQNRTRFNKLYIANYGTGSDTKAIRSVVEETAADKPFLLADYKNIGYDMCDKMPHIVALSKKFQGVNCEDLDMQGNPYCQCHSSGSSSTMIIKNLDEMMKLWPDLTAKIRLD